MRSLGGRAPAAPAQHDPAPSRLDYRWQRMMLTPGFRALVRVGLPLVLIVVIAMSWLSHAENRAALGGWAEARKEAFQDRPQFQVHGITLTGADPGLAAEVAALLPDSFPVSSFALDLPAMRQAIEAHLAVKSATVRLGDAGQLLVAVTPRRPVALWRDGTDLHLVDADGVPAGRIAARAARLDLPLIAGQGAEQHLTEAMALFAATGPLRARVRGLVRIGARRWDLVLDRGQRVLLPADGAVAAMQRVIALDHAHDMLSRDIALVDMRSADRPTLRMMPEAATALRRISFDDNLTGRDQDG